MKTAKQAPQKKTLPALSFHKNKKLFFVRLNGRPVYLGKDRRLAEQRYHRAIAEWLARGKQTAPPPPDEITVAEVADRYLSHCEAYYRESPANIISIKSAINGLAPYLDVRAQDFGPLALQAVRDAFVVQELSRVYINHLTRSIVRMFKWATAQQIIRPDVFHGLNAVEGLRAGFCSARESKKRRPMTEEEMNAVLPYLPTPVSIALQVLFLCGARPSEILNLKPADIDRSRPDVWRVNVEHHKNERRGKSRTLWFGPRVQRLISPLLLRPADQYLFKPTESMQEVFARRSAARKTPLSCGNRPGSNVVDKPERLPGECYDRHSFRRAISRAIAKVNQDRAAQDLPLLREFCPYETRHATATRVREVAGLDASAAVLGHSSASTTAAFYAKLSEETAAAVMARIG